MKVWTLGTEPPEVAVVGAIHGDEPAGSRAIERFVEESPPVERSVKLILANERALAGDVRYVDADLNRSFPGHQDDISHEGRLAAELTAELQDCRTLSLHSTQSHDEPFAVVRELNSTLEPLVVHLPITAIVETGDMVQGRLFAALDELVEVEVGEQGTAQAIENAYEVMQSYLIATGVLQGDVKPRGIPVFRLRSQISKAPAEEYEVFVNNFEAVSEGERYAAADGEESYAQEGFYPVLMSAEGYGDLYGYAADKVGVVGNG